jgi:geranylgeranyl reductase family protein
METCDVIIVGGGPAGSSCAWKLRAAGWDVVVVDRANFPRDKVCAGWITPAVIEELQLDLEDYRRDRTLQPITGFVTGLIGEEEITTEFNQPVSYGIRRCEFDDYLLRRCGARLRLNEAFDSLRREGKVWILNERLQAPVLIGAGGHFCPVARRCAPDPKETEDSVVAAQEIEFAMTDSQRELCTVSGTRPELFFCPDLRGYGWVFRKGEFLNIGLGRENETHLASHRAAFVEFLQARNKIPHDLPQHFHGHAYRLRTRPRQTQEPGVLLIGDSAGLADRHSGEGIRPAIESGLLAASALLECRSATESDLGEVFQKKLQMRLNNQPSTGIAAWIPSSLRLSIARWLMSTHWFTRHVLLSRWFLHTEQPPLRV